GGTRGDDRGTGPGARSAAELLRPGHAGRATGALGAQLAVPCRAHRPGVRPDADPAGTGRGGRRGPARLPVRLHRRDARPAGTEAARTVPGAEDRRARTVEVPCGAAG